MQSTNQRQDSLRDAQTKTEFQITTLKKEQAELKTKVNELLKLNEDVSLFFIQEHEKQKANMRDRKAMYEAELNKRNTTIEMLKQKFFGNQS